MKATTGILMEVMAERCRQDTKWGVQRHGFAKWMTILGEEFGEACKSALKGECDNYRAELIQVAAVAVAAIESYEAMKGDPDAPE